jgi:TPR repeat protein
MSTPPNDTEAVKWYRLAAERGDASGQSHLGAMYLQGLGVVADSSEALKWLRLAAAQNEASSQNWLGLMYQTGWGVPQAVDEAVKWYRLAAERGDALGQSHLGVMYENGWGVPQDYIRAHMWFNLAVAQGKEEAVDHRDFVASMMTPDQIAEAQRLALEWKPKAERDVFVMPGAPGSPMQPTGNPRSVTAPATKLGGRSCYGSDRFVSGRARRFLIGLSLRSIRTVARMSARYGRYARFIERSLPSALDGALR